MLGRGSDQAEAVLRQLPVNKGEVKRRVDHREDQLLNKETLRMKERWTGTVLRSGPGTGRTIRVTRRSMEGFSTSERTFVEIHDQGDGFGGSRGIACRHLNGTSLFLLRELIRRKLRHKKKTMFRLNVPVSSLT